MPLVFIWMIFIFLLSAFPNLSLLYLGTWDNRSHAYLIDVHKIDWNLVLSWKNPFFRIPSYNYLYIIINKLGHIFVFSVLGWLSYRATRRILLSFWICVAYAFFDELHQAFTPGRSSRLTDVIIDATAALLAIWLASRVYPKIKSTTKRATKK